MHAQKLSKTQTKQANIMGVQYFPGLWYCLQVHQQEWCKLCLIIYSLFISLPHKLHQLLLFSSSTESVHRPQHRRSYGDLWPHIPPTPDEANLTTMNPPPDSANPSTRPPRCHRCNRCPKPSGSDEDFFNPWLLQFVTDRRLAEDDDHQFWTIYVASIYFLLISFPQIALRPTSLFLLIPPGKIPTAPISGYCDYDIEFLFHQVGNCHHRPHPQCAGVRGTRNFLRPLLSGRRRCRPFGVAVHRPIPSMYYHP